MLKGWNSEWLTSCPTWNCTIAQSLKPVLWSHGLCFRPVHSAIVKGFLTSLPWKSYFPLGVTHPWPSENYPQWRWECSRSTMASIWQNTSAELFHGLRCLIWAFLNNDVRSRWGSSITRSECICAKTIVPHPESEIVVSGQWHLCFRSLLLHVWIE